ncbi:MAG: hypothetical protein K0R39_1669 [Symbiobacteriaceae bacterium]|nr:hypothetical protein [Symbiobacteriaceae bacterium]
MTYSGMFLRSYIGQQPGQNAGGWSASPDIILYGTQPANDPTIFTNSANYNTDYGSTVYLNQINYVYVRGFNNTTAAETARIWLYYTRSDLALWPSNWWSSNIQMQGANLNYTTMEASSNQIGVTNPPFLWTPPTLGGNNTHYCVVAFAENPPLSSPPQSPAPTGYMGTTQDLANYILSTPNMAWRNTIDVSQNTPTWQQVTNITGPTEGGLLQIGIQCTNMPNDAYVSFNVPGPDAQNTINVPKMQISNGNLALSLPVTWPAGFSSSIQISYWQGSQTPQKGATITPTLWIPQTQVSYELQASTRHRPVHVFAFESPKMLYLAPTKMYVIGAVPYRFS